MKLKYGSVLAMLFSLTIIITYGCAIHRVNLVDNGTVLLELVPSDDGDISQVHVFQDDGKMVISGKVEPAKHSSSIHKGHVAITVIAPDGTVIQEISAPDTPTSVRRLATGKRFFTAHFKLVPAPGTKIRLAYRSH